MDGADGTILLHELLGFGIVSGRGAAANRGGEQADRQPFGAVQLVVVPDGAAGDTRRIDERVEPQAFEARDRSTGRQGQAGIHAVVAVRGEEIVGGEKRRHDRAITHGMAMGWDDEGQRADEVRRDDGEAASLPHELAHGRERAVLKRPDAAVYGLETVERRRRSEIAAIDEGRLQAPRRQLAEGGESIDAAANDENVEGLVRQALEVTNHQMSHSTPRLPRVPGVARLGLACGVFALLAGCSSPTGPPPPPPPPAALTVTCPANVDVQSPDGAPVNVSFASPQTAGGVAPVSTTCSSAPGSFAVGSTGVTCQATDSRGQGASCIFVVAVRPPPRLRFTRFLAFGDSLTAGEVSIDAVGNMFYSPNDSYPTVLQKRLAARYVFQSITIINAGIGGESATEGGSARFRSVLQQNRPEVVLLMEGANDLLDRPDIGRGADTAIAALRRMVQDAKGLNVTVALATVPPQRAGGVRHRDAVAQLIPSFNDRIRAVATSEGVLLIDVYAGMKNDISLIGVDDLHPTIRGYDTMAGIFFEAIKSSLEVVSSEPRGSF